MIRRDFLSTLSTFFITFHTTKYEVKRLYLNTNDRYKFCVLLSTGSSNNTFSVTVVPLEKFNLLSEEEVIKSFYTMNEYQDINIYVYHIKNLNGESNIFVTNDPGYTIQGNL